MFMSMKEHCDFTYYAIFWFVLHIVILFHFRIERLWREIWTGCTYLFYQLFYFMEDNGILDIDNEIHIQALHIVFKPRIQNHLDQLRCSLRRRPLRTEKNKTPLQLWIEGQIRDPKLDLTEVIQFMYIPSQKRNFCEI